MWSLPSPRTPQGALSCSYASYEARRAECVWREVEVPQILRSLRAIAGRQRAGSECSEDGAAPISPISAGVAAG